MWSLDHMRYMNLPDGLYLFVQPQSIIKFFLINLNIEDFSYKRNEHSDLIKKIDVPKIEMNLP